MIRRLSLALVCCAAAAAHADTIDPQPRSEWWLDSGFYTRHFQSDKGLNGANRGLGAEYRFSTVAAATGGRFYNSDRAWSSYAGVFYQPWAFGPVRVGAVVGVFNGYPKMRDGGWFPALIPALGMEYGRVGLNIGIVPTYKDRLYGGISFQARIRLSD
ncbi:MAG TPA: hypothetical protein VFF16_11050 [Telluria sp.]|nr:hypothetical protein [Telluria sp.]